jgi:excisionase family DNA binding protein
MQTQIWLSVEQLAQRFGVKRSWVYSNYKKEGIPSRKIGGHLRFSVVEVEKWESTSA